MFAYVIAGVVVAVTLYIALFDKKNTNAPAPKWSLPIIHETLLGIFCYQELDDWLVKFSKTLGKTFLVRMLGQPSLLVTADPGNVEYILKTNFDNYIKGTSFSDRLTDLLGHGIFNVDGASWKTQRKITSNLFNVKTFRDSIHLVMEKHVGYLNRHVDESMQRHGYADVNDLMHRFTLDSIGQIAFGFDIGALQNKEVPFVRAWDESNTTATRRFFQVSMALSKLLSPDEWTMRTHLKTIDDFCADVIRRRREEGQESIEGRGDLLSLFMTRTDEDGKPYTEKFLKDMIVNMIIAGRDTTAQSLCWTLYLLCNNPEKLKKLQDELDDVLGDHPIEFEDIHETKLKYLYATITESLRLYPSVPRDLKMAVNDDVLPDGTIVTKGQTVVYVPYVMGRTEALWGPDCLEFKPERFLNDLHPSQYKFTAFQGGYRRCLGADLAYHEEQVVLASLLQKYDIALVPNQNLRMNMSLTAAINGPMKIVFTPRKR